MTEHDIVIIGGGLLVWLPLRLQRKREQKIY